MLLCAWILGRPPLGQHAKACRAKRMDATQPLILFNLQCTLLVGSWPATIWVGALMAAVVRDMLHGPCRTTSTFVLR